MPGLGHRLRVLDAQTRLRAKPDATKTDAPPAPTWRLQIVLIAVLAAGGISTVLGSIASLLETSWGAPLAITGLATIGAAAISWGISLRVNETVAIHALFVLGLGAIVADSFFLRPPAVMSVSLISPLLASIGIMLLMRLRQAAVYLVATAVMQFLLLWQAGVPWGQWMATFASMGLFTALAAYRRDAIEASLRDLLQKQQGAREELSLMVENAPDAMAMLSEEGRFLRWNRKCNDFYLTVSGRPADSRSGIWDGLDDEAALHMIQCTRVAHEGKVVEVNLGTSDGDPQRRWHVVLSPCKLSMGAGVVAMVREISESDALIQDHREQMHKQRLSLLNVASHDLRTPLTPLVMEASLLASSRLGPLTPAQGQAVSVIVRNVTRLRRFVDHLATAYAFEHNPPRATTRRTLLAEVLDEAAVEAAAIDGVPCPIVGTVDPALHLDADHELLKAAVVHLVENAALHAPRETDVVLEAEEKDGMATIHVRDHGAIPQNDPAARLFEPFHEDLAVVGNRAHGLPLHLANRCMEIMGGKMTVCEQHTDACFALQLPTHVEGRRSERPSRQEQRRRAQQEADSTALRDES